MRKVSDDNIIMDNNTALAYKQHEDSKINIKKYIEED